MLSSLLRPRKGRRRVDHSPFSSPFAAGSPEQVRDRRRPRQETTSDDEEDDRRDYEGDPPYDDLDEDDDDEPLLPIFSAAHLDILPVYDITHTIRMLIIQKCETTLSWDQLRSPQISQFLVKPVQMQIRADYFKSCTLLALIANCLQFKKEAEINLGNAGVNKTRALFAELLAMRLLREYSTRELIDALSYDFDPLHGMASDPRTPSKPASKARIARISTVEIAIRATAKKFLAHPLVVQQLEAIWAGSIVFHSAADSLHRKPPKDALKASKQKGYGTLAPATPPAGPANGKNPAPAVKAQKEELILRRSVTLYDPREASLFKLSRLRVPRYRQVFTTLSFAVMLGLFLAVLIDRSLTITPLEIAFWIYSAGYMLDEVVGFTEQGFGLYIISVWNAFDLGILLLFICYYVLRLYGILVPEAGKHKTAGMAYDVLGSTAVLLFPRAFSVLDHYRYFSQLLIAFRMMAQDLVAVLILIIISVSGFFVAFTLSFSDENTNGGSVAYTVFQLLMGFTPAAWTAWEQYNVLGRIVLTLFLFITHFLVIVILTTVLTNSFMAIVQNANEEHQFLFAVNTISMVKSDALFSFIAPTNVLSWVISPLRFVISFRQFVKLNRTIIKISHFPVLFSIFAYERMILSKIAYEPADLVERPMRGQSQPVAFGPSEQQRETLQHRPRLREASVVSFRKDQALDEVFRRPFRSSTVREAGQQEGGRSRSSNVVDAWMQDVGREGGASPPLEQPRLVLDRLEGRRPLFRRAMTTDRLRTGRRDYSMPRSTISDPEDRSLFTMARRPKKIDEESSDPNRSLESIPQETEGEDGDDELMTHDEADNVTVERSSVPTDHTPPRQPVDDPPSRTGSGYFTTPHGDSARSAPRGSRQDTRGTTTPQPPESVKSRKPKRSLHDRNASNSTIVFQPPPDNTSSSDAQPISRNNRPTTVRHNTTLSFSEKGARTPKTQDPPRLRPQVPARQTQPPPTESRNIQGANHIFSPRRREASFNTMALDLASDLGDNRFGPALVDVGGISGMPASFSEQMIRERDAVRRAKDDERRRSETEQKEVLSRMVLNRMNTLEEGFKEIIHAVRDLRTESRAGTGSEGRGSVGGDRPGSRGLLGGFAAGNGGRSSAASSAGFGSKPQGKGGDRRDKGPRSPKKPKRPTHLRQGEDAEGISPGTRVEDFAATRVVDAQDEPLADPQHKGKEKRDSSSSTSVRGIVREIDRRTGSQRVGSATQASGGQHAGEEASAARDVGEGSAAPVVGSRRRTDDEGQSGRDEDGEWKRKSVIFVGDGAQKGEDGTKE